MTRRIALLVLLLASLLACRPFPMRAAEEGEPERLVALLALEPGDTVAEIGAGDGELAVGVAGALGPRSRVWATELPDVLDELRETIERSGVPNVHALEALPDETNLPPACCDAIFMRRVYHHFKNPARNNASLRRSLRPGGRLAVIDFEARKHWDQPEGTPENRGGHGMPSALLIEELERAGFELVRLEREWEDDLYAAVFVVRDP